MKIIISFAVLISLFGSNNAVKTMAEFFKPHHETCCARGFPDEANQRLCLETLEEQLTGSHLEAIFKNAAQDKHHEDEYKEHINYACNAVIEAQKARPTVITAEKFAFVLAVGTAQFTKDDIVRFTGILASKNKLDEAIKLTANYWQTLFDDDGLFVQGISWRLDKSEKEKTLQTILSEEFKKFYPNLHKWLVEVKGEKKTYKRCRVENISSIYNNNLNL